MRAPEGLRDVGTTSVLVAGSVAAAQMTWGVVVPALPLYAREFSASPALLGTVVAAFGVGRLLIDVPAGALLHRVRPQRLVVGLALALAAVTAVSGLAPSTGWLLAARFVAGVLGGAAVTVGLALVTLRAPAGRRGSVLAVAQGVQLAGGAVGPFLGGVVLDVSGSIAVTFLVAAVPLLALGTALALRRDATFWARPAHGPTAGPVPGASRTVGWTFAGLLVLSFATFFVRFGGEQSLVPLLAYDVGGMTPTGYGAAAGLAAVVSMALLPTTARSLDRGWRLRVMVPTLLTAAGATLLFPVAGGPWAYAGVVVVVTVLTGVGSLVPGVWLADVVPAHRTGVAVGASRTVGDLGGIVGPLTTGLVLTDAGAGPAAAVLALVSAASLFVFAGCLLVGRAQTSGAGKRYV